MGPTVTPTAKPHQSGALRSNSQVGSSRTFESHISSALANMGTERSESDTPAGNSLLPRLRTQSDATNTLHSLPVLKCVGNLNASLLQQPQTVNQRPGGYMIMSEQHTPTSALLPYPLSSSPFQYGQSSRTMFQSHGSQGHKSRVTIAISGSPASGKSTLVYLLAAIFEGATIRDTGFASAQTIYPVFNGRVPENPNRKGPITKVFVVHQNSCIKPVAECPLTEWSELYPYSPTLDVMNPQVGAARAFANERGNRSYERYWEAACQVNMGVDPRRVSKPSSPHFPPLVAPSPTRMSKNGPNLDCRGAVDWVKFGKAISDGMRGHKNDKGAFETEVGRDKIEAYLGQTHQNTGIPLVSSRKLEPLRELIRQWIRDETAQNDRIGFPGHSLINGSMREIFILDGSLLYLQTHPRKGCGGEKLMKACDVKLFLPTLETEAIQRYFSQAEYMDPPKGTRQPEETWMLEGYFSEVAWKGYKSEHAWLFENGNPTNRSIKTSLATCHYGIHVRDFYSANLEEKGQKHNGKKWADETLDWAVRTILFQLSGEEEFGRQAFFKENLNEATGNGAAERAG